MTKVVQCDEAGLSSAAAILNGGGVVVIPTDTVYGLAARPDFPAAVERLYTIKNREAKKPIAMLASSPERTQIAHSMTANWPGALTIVCKGEGYRVPDHEWTRNLIEKCGGLLRVTSANISGQCAATDAAAALEEVGIAADLVVDGGVSPGGVPSTVVRLHDNGFVETLRKGTVPVRQKYRVIIAFDGTGYSGWQYQDNATGIQQIVEEALAYLEGGPVRVFGSSRTDAGVHADGFVAHFHLTKPIPPANLVRAMNSRLPESVRILKAAYAKDSFDARLSALGKEYRYQLYQADILPPKLAPFWTFCHRPLDLAAMRDGAARFVGKHDFVSFAANPNRVLETTVRTVFSFEIKKAGPRYTFIVRGDGFLYKQVRSMVGFLISIGKGVERPEAVSELLAAATPRTARVETAPPRGLSLHKVFYRYGT